jgi:hypothetical protein
MFFKVSHIAASLLCNTIEKKKIEGRTLKTYVKTRWTTMYDCINSVLRCKEVFNDVSYFIFNIYLFYLLKN